MNGIVKLYQLPIYTLTSSFKATLSSYKTAFNHKIDLVFLVSINR